MAIRYTVVMTQEASNQLTAIWVNAPSPERAAITQASHELETEVAADAHQKGCAYPLPGQPSRKALFCYPLLMYFEVSEPDRLVRIVGYTHLGAGIP
jgi:hypothetical protein